MEDFLREGASEVKREEAEGEENKKEGGAEEARETSRKRKASGDRPMAIRGYWAGKRGRGGRGRMGGANRIPDQSTPVEADSSKGKKRKGSHDNDGSPDFKTRRTASPSCPPASPEIYSPPSERDTEADTTTEARPAVPEGADRNVAMEQGPEVDLVRERPVERRNTARLYINQPNTVHLIFPLDPDSQPPSWLRRGYRPDFPYPFTGAVARADREVVRRALERDWRQEAAQVDDATDVGVAALFQMRTFWLWENGWRRSRFSGNWGFYGSGDDEDHQGRLNAETQMRGEERQRAQRRLDSLRRAERELLIDPRPVTCEAMTRLIWDRLQLIRRAFATLSQDDREHLFQFDGQWVRNDIAERQIIVRNPAPGIRPRSPATQSRPTTPQPQPQPQLQNSVGIPARGPDMEARRLEHQRDFQEILAEQAQGVVDNVNRILQQAEELNLPAVGERARAEMEVAQENLRRRREDMGVMQARYDARRAEVNLQREQQRREELRNRQKQNQALETPNPGAGLQAWRGRGRRERGRGRPLQTARRGGGRGHFDERRMPERRADNEVRRQPEHNDPWRMIQAQKAAMPAIHDWRHRMRVAELQMLETHPQREHIRRVLESEEAAAAADAKALVRSQELTGAATSFDISWPPSKSVTVKFGKPGRDLEIDTESEEDEERPRGRYYGAVPPPNCGYGKYRGHRGNRRGRGGQGGANMLGV